MKKILLALCLVAGTLWADSDTNRLDLVLPTVGSASWATKTNNNWQILDSTVAGLGVANTFTSSNTFNAYTYIDNLRGRTATWTGQINASSMAVTGLAPNQCVQTTTGGLLTVSGSQCNSGGGGSSSSSTLVVTQNQVVVSSPTRNINILGPPLLVTLTGSATATISVDPSSVTLQGNTFNAANQLTKLDSLGTLSVPTIQASSMTVIGPLHMVTNAADFFTMTTLGINTPLSIVGHTIFYPWNSINSVGIPLRLLDEETVAGKSAYVVVDGSLQLVSISTMTSPLVIATTMTASSATFTNISVSSLGSGQCVQTTTGGRLTTSGLPCGSGGGGSGASLTSTNTWTAQQTFNNTITVSSHVVIASSDSVPALKVTANGGDYGTNVGTSGGTLISCPGTTGQGMCAQVYSNAGTQNNLTGVLNVISGSSYDSTTLYVEALGTDPENGIRVDGNDYACMALVDTSRSSGSKNGRFQFSSHNNQLRGERRNSGNTAYESGWVIASSTLSTGGVMMVSTGYENPASTLAVNGNLIVGDGYAGATTGGAAPINGALIEGAVILKSSSSLTGQVSVGNDIVFGLGSTPGSNTYSTKYRDAGLDIASQGYTNTSGAGGVGRHFFWRDDASNELMTLGMTSGQLRVSSGIYTSSMTVSSVTLNGTGNLAFTPADGNTYNILGSSGTLVPGHTVVVSTAYGLIDSGGTGGGTPGGSTNQVQYNSAGVFAGSSKFQFNGTSVTVTSSMTVNTQAGNAPFENDIVGTFNVFNDNDPVDTTPLFSVGSNTGKNQFYVPSRAAVKASFGFQAGDIYLGRAGSSLPDSIASINSANNEINIWSGQGVTGEMSLKTGAAAGRDIVLIPEESETMRISSHSVTVNSTMTVRSTIAAGNLISFSNTSGAGNPFTVNFNHVVTGSRYNIFNGTTWLGTTANAILLENDADPGTGGDIQIKPQVDAQVIMTTGTVVVSSMTFAGSVFAGLGAPSNGTMKYCSDCTVTTPATCTANLLTSCICTGSGSGAFAKRLNGTWYCN